MKSETKHWESRKCLRKSDFHNSLTLLMINLSENINQFCSLVRQRNGSWTFQLQQNLVEYSFGRTEK